MNEDRMREIAREEINAYMTRMAETVLLDWSLVESQAGQSMPQMKAMLDELAPMIGMNAINEGNADD